MTDGPNFEAYLDAIYRRNDPTRVPIGELFVELRVMEEIIGEPAEYDGGSLTERSMRLYLEAHAKLGYDAVTVGVGTGFTTAEWAVTDDVAPLSRGKRAYVTAAASRIWDRESFDAYVWPTPEQISYTPLERAAKAMPEGMKILASCGGPCEWLMWIVGYEPLSFMLADDPALVQLIMGRIEEQMKAIFRELVTHERVGAVWISDDMGYKTGTFLSPPQMREIVLPAQRELAAIAHEAGLPVLLHSCGNLAAIMDDLIDDVKIDAKHSWEDVITPVAEAKRLWGDRIAIIGGVDVDALTRRTPDEVRAYTLRVLDDCAPGGGYLLGSGNSIANYIPVRNYLAMLDAWREWSAAQHR